LARFRRLRVQVKKVGAKLRPARRAISGARSKVSRGARKNMRSMGVGRARSLLILPALLLLILFAAWMRAAGMHTVQFIPTGGAISNPLIGAAANARTGPEYAPQDTRLAWVVATWRELEPVEGEYAFDAFDEAIHLTQWRERDTKLIFRLSLDSTGSGCARDIPDWLHKKAPGGVEYEAAGQQCYAPDYADPLLQEAHLRLLQAVAQRYGDDIAYVEIGSLGPDGAWRSIEGAPQMPMVDVTGVYIWQYFTAFPDHMLLAAGPYHEAMLSGGGVYLNALGGSGRTWEWINMLRFGGWDEETGVLLRPQEDFGLSAPAGAWLCPDADLNGLAELVRETRASYLCVDHFAAGGLLDEVSEALGYRYWVRQAQWPERVRRDYSLYVDICMANSGCAPMAADWPMYLALLDENGAVMHSERAETDVREWLPGDSGLRVRITVPSDMERGVYTLAFAVCEPDTLEPAVRFAMECETVGLWHVLGNTEVH